MRHFVCDTMTWSPSLRCFLTAASASAGAGAGSTLLGLVAVSMASPDARSSSIVTQAETTSYTASCCSTSSSSSWNLTSFSAVPAFFCETGGQRLQDRSARGRQHRARCRVRLTDKKWTRGTNECAAAHENDATARDICAHEATQARRESPPRRASVNALRAHVHGTHSTTSALILASVAACSMSGSRRHSP